MEIPLKKRRNKRGRRSVRRTHRTQMRSPRLRVSREKIRQAWRATRVRLLGLVLLSGLLALLGYMFFSWDFYVYGATITGNRWLADEVIYAASGVDTQNIFWISPRRVAAAIEQVPGVRQASVRVSLPARVRIRIEEREPVLVWRTPSGDLWLDSEAVALPYGGQPDGATFVVDKTGQTYQAGEQVEPKIVASVRALQAAFPNVRVYYYRGHEGLSFLSEEGWPIQIGTSEDTARKVAVLQALSRQLQEQGVQPNYVDLRLVDHPVYAVGQPAAPAGGE